MLTLESLRGLVCSTTVTGLVRTCREYGYEVRVGRRAVFVAYRESAYRVSGGDVHPISLSAFSKVKDLEPIGVNYVAILRSNIRRGATSLTMREYYKLVRDAGASIVEEVIDKSVPAFMQSPHYVKFKFEGSFYTIKRDPRKIEGDVTLSLSF